MRAGHVAVWAALAFGLGACGHGSSGRGSLSSGTVAVPFQGANTSTAYEASSATASFTAGTGITATGAPEPADTAANTVTISTNANGGLSSLTVNIGTTNGGAPTASSVVITNGLGDTGMVSAIAATVLKVAQGGVPEAVYQGSADQLAYSAFGMWMQNTGGASYNVGTFALGSETATAEMPTTGTASYSGAAIGFGANGAAPFAFAGQAAIGVNFATNAVTGLTLSNFTTRDVNDALAGPTLPTLTGTGSLSGTTYTVPIAGGALNGSAAGAFYGPSANETAGTFQAAGGAISLLGSFGAHR